MKEVIVRYNNRYIITMECMLPDSMSSEFTVHCPLCWHRILRHLADLVPLIPYRSVTVTRISTNRGEPIPEVEICTVFVSLCREEVEPQPVAPPTSGRESEYRPLETRGWALQRRSPFN